MVILLPGSGIDHAAFPNIHRWDTLVRKHHDHYQHLIDAATYRLQRIQRGVLVKNNKLSPSRTPSTTALNCSPSTCSSANSRWERSISWKSTSTRISTLKSQPTTTALSSPDSTCLALGWASALLALRSRHISTSQCLCDWCCWQAPSLSTTYVFLVTQSMRRGL